MRIECVLVLRLIPSAGKAMEYWAGPPWKVRCTVWGVARSSIAAAETVAARPRARAMDVKDFIVMSRVAILFCIRSLFVTVYCC